MIHADPYGAGDDDLDDLPPLPIPRPGEWSPMAAAPQSAEPRLAPPALGGGLGGGASFTAAGADEAGTTAPEPVDPAEPASELSRTAHERLESERFTWEIAARLTSGLLANPTRGNASVKDAMGLFDQLLQEMKGYTKIASELDVPTDEAARRRQHEEYFQHQRSSSTSPERPEAEAATPKPEPTQPRPMGDYRPIPPGSRAPYSPGSMAGAPPTEQQGDEHAA